MQVEHRLNGSVLPDTGIIWELADGTFLDLSTGYTMTSVAVAKKSKPDTLLFTKTSGLTGQAGTASTPSLVVGWSTSADITTLDNGEYLATATVTRNSDSKPRKAQWVIVIEDTAG